MANIPTLMLVVAAALRDVDGRLLLQQRPLHKHHGGLWEFPGGKVESGEIPRFALCREIAEELGITLRSEDLAPALAADEGPEGRVVLFVYTCSVWHGQPSGMEGQEWGWFTAEEARNLPMPPMDSDLLQRLQQ